jgi:Rrf2 family protein
MAVSPLQVRTIAEERGLSVGFLEQSMNLLKKSGLVEGVRGMRGGYRIIRPPEQIRLREILQAIEGAAQKSPPASTAEEGVLSEVEAGVNALLSDHLETISLRALVQRVERMESKSALMFHI